MRAEDFDSATIEQLQGQANKCFEQAQSPLDEAPHYLDDAGKLRLLLEAQFYLTAVARKRDERVARRDFRLEVAVIVLLGIEIVLSLIFGIVAIHEGTQQAEILGKVKQSTADTATAMQIAKDSLKTLADDQDKSLDRLKDMNDNLQASLTTTRKMANAMNDTNAKLQASLTTTGTMVEAMKEQLRILEMEQTERLAQEAKKPNLELFIGGRLVIDRFGLTFSGPDFPFTTQGDTDTTFDLRLRNTGGADTNRTDLRVCVVSKSDDVGVQISKPVYVGVQMPNTPYEITTDLAQTHNPLHTFLIHLGPLRRGEEMPLTIAFNYPKGHPEIPVFYYVVQTDDIRTQTQIGSMIVTPRKPQN
jgi:hypothetical protein